MDVQCDPGSSFRIISLVSRSPRVSWIIYYMVPQRIQALEVFPLPRHVITNNKSLPAFVPTGNVSGRVGCLHTPWQMLNNDRATGWRILSFARHNLESSIYDTLLKRHYLETGIRNRKNVHSKDTRGWSLENVILLKIMFFFLFLVVVVLLLWAFISCYTLHNNEID